LLFPRDFGLGMDANRAFPMRFPSFPQFFPIFYPFPAAPRYTADT
jgi:hypothetical protein